jgi:CMP-N-acetylneuraminic acid synthetase
MIGNDERNFTFKVNENEFKSEIIFTSNSGAIKLSSLEVQDIDNYDDWKLAELKAKIFMNKRDY